MESRRQVRRDDSLYGNRQITLAELDDIRVDHHGWGRWRGDLCLWPGGVRKRRRRGGGRADKWLKLERVPRQRQHHRGDDPRHAQLDDRTAAPDACHRSFTGVPTVTREASFSASQLVMRTQPCDSVRPICEGSGVPWNPKCSLSMPIQTTPTGLFGPAAIFALAWLGSASQNKSGL